MKKIIGFAIVCCAFYACGKGMIPPAGNFVAVTAPSIALKLREGAERLPFFWKQSTWHTSC